MKIAAIVEARMASKRLPGKVLLKAKNITMLDHLIDRLKKVKILNEIIVATTINPLDQEIVDFCNIKEIKYFRGSEDDVMGRVIGAAESCRAQIIVEITADCPIIDPSIVEQIVNIYLSNKVDYVSNANIRSYPDGMDTQVFSLDILKSSYQMTCNKLDREHVTLHIRNNPDIFSNINVIAPPEINLPNLGLTLDEQDDYIFIKNIIENLYDKNNFFSCLEIVNYLKENKSLLNINSHIRRKGNT
tara:strand:- start:27 stop:761 length:735 start_codon:yes stop_codon:yes gene_type:complete